MFMSSQKRVFENSDPSDLYVFTCATRATKYHQINTMYSDAEI